MNLLDEINAEQVAALGKDIPDFKAGDTLRVGVFVTEGSQTRIQRFEGVCIARKNGAGISGSFTVRKISFGVGVERVFPLHSTNVESIEVVRRGRVKRAKLYYLRQRRGKSARIAEHTNYKPKREPARPCQTVHRSGGNRSEEQHIDNVYDRDAIYANLNLIMEFVKRLNLARDQGNMAEAAANLAVVRGALPSENEFHSNPERYFDLYMELASHAVPLMVFGESDVSKVANELCQKLGGNLRNKFNLEAQSDPIASLLRTLGVIYVMRFDGEIVENKFSCSLKVSDLWNELGISKESKDFVFIDESSLRVTVRREDNVQLKSTNVIGPHKCLGNDKEWHSEFSETLPEKNAGDITYFVRVDGKIVRRMTAENLSEKNSLRLIL